MTCQVVNDRAKRKLFWEIVVCFGPTCVFLPVGLLIVPHQLLLVIENGRLSSLWTVFYYVAMVVLLVLMRRMYRVVTKGDRALFVFFWPLLFIAVAGLIVGPGGTFVLGGSVSVGYLIVLVIMPLGCVGHLTWMTTSCRGRSRDEAS